MSSQIPEPKSTALPKRTKEGRREGGQFEADSLNESDGSLSRVNTRLASMTPVAVDTELAAHYKILRPVKAEIWKQTDFLIEAREFKRITTEYPGTQKYRYVSWRFNDVDTKIAAAEEKIGELQTQVDEYRAEHTEPLEAEFIRRGRWSRFFLVTGNTGGHIHSSTHCSSCNPRTQMVWLVDEAGKSEDEIVAKAGDGACTICYSSAPIADKRNPRPNPFEDPEIKAARELRAHEKADRDAVKRAKGIFSPTGGPVTDHEGHAFATEVAAERFMLQEMDYIGWYEKEPDAVEAELQAIANVQIALIAKRGVSADEFRSSWTKKVNDKAKRDSMNSMKAGHMRRALNRVNEIVDSRDSSV
jgi:hypothetical protein